MRERVTLLRDQDTGKKLRAISDLGKAHGSSRARKALLAELKHEKNPHIRARIVDALGDKPDKDGVAALIEIAGEDSEADSRRAAVKALAFVKSEEAVAALMRVFADSGEEIGVRLSAADSLTRYQSEAVFQTFVAAFSDADGRVRAQAVVSLYNAFGSDKARVRPYLEGMAGDSEAGDTARLYLERLGD